MNDKFSFCKMRSPDQVDYHFHDDASGCRVIQGESAGGALYLALNAHQCDEFADCITDVIEDDLSYPEAVVYVEQWAKAMKNGKN